MYMYNHQYIHPLLVTLDLTSKSLLYLSIHCAMKECWTVRDKRMNIFFKLLKELYNVV